ncbi:hypothetical protein [Flavisolibacter tropicus]|nr:hypothetical protein [Flavisolibacter tropicus]
MIPSFDFSRWVLLVKQHWIENKKRYLLSVGAAAGILSMWFFFMMMVNDLDPMEDSIQRGTYFFLLFSGGCFYASQFFRELGSRSKAINYLLLPASSLEKLMVSLLYVVVLYFIVYTAIFFLVDMIMVNFANAFHSAYNTPNANGVIHKASVVNVFSWFGIENAIPFFLAAFFAVQAAFLLGSVYFERYSFVKTIISLFCLLIVLWLIVGFLLNSLLPHGSYMRDIGTYRISSEKGEGDYLIELPLVIRKVIIALFQWGFPFFFWVVTYFRLKEKEV